MKFSYPQDIKDMPPPEWIFHELLQKNSTALLYGPSNLGKSFVALELICALATGRSDVFKPMCDGRALYVCGEGLAGLSIRILAWEKDRLHILPAKNPAFVGKPLQLANPKDRRLFIKAVQAEFDNESPILSIFDTLARCMVGLDENSAKDMGMVVDGLEEIRQELLTTVMPVHHSAKSDPTTERGSGALLGAVDTALSLVRDGNYLSLTCPKQKNGHRAPAVRLQLKRCHGSCVLSADIKSELEDQQARLRELLTEPGAAKLDLPKRVFMREAFPPQPWEGVGDTPICSVTPMGSKVRIEQIRRPDPDFRTWLDADRRLRQRHPEDGAEAAPFAYICESREFWEADEEKRAAILEQRRIRREDQLGGRGDPYLAVSDLEVAWWIWGIVSMGIPQADVMRWYEVPRAALQKVVQSWKKFGLLPYTEK